ncbi:MAG: hypothetical protein AMXMBFR7_24080 [Planctomycetota bacterium]
MWPFTERITTPDGEPYLYRYTLLYLPGFRLYLHRIFRADGDRHLHDHPWNFTSLVLKGGYREETPQGIFERRAGALIRHKAEDYHRILELYTQSAWTLVLCGRKRRPWGFLVGNRWIPWNEYLRESPPEAPKTPSAASSSRKALV